MMKDREQRQAAKKFVQYWKQKAGYEKGETQSFWTMLLREVYGIEEPEKFITFEDQVKVGQTKFIDARILKTRVMIEQKSSDVDLLKPIRQSGGAMLTPYQQARNYVNGLNVDEHPLWIVVCNFNEIHIHDMHTPDDPPVVIKLEDLEKEYYRLNFLVKLESSITPKEMELSLKAGELVGAIYDALLKQYEDKTNPESLKSLNKLCVRLVFCLYAEDAGLFGEHSAFHDYLKQFQPKHVRRAIIDLFRILNTKVEDRNTYEREEYENFPYVNGGLFADEDIEIPQFTQDIIDLILAKASEEFNWSEISPTIFGAVFESTLNPESRRKGGMHYTSVENIHKVIDPLFLNDLKNELKEILQKKQKNVLTEMLFNFQKKLSHLVFLDPACGSGNFLTETYISLRRLENDVLRVLAGGTEYFDFGDNGPIHVQINQFSGIEINDFAVSVAQTALWIAESQMLKETEDIIKKPLHFLPLKSITNIVEGNALQMDWNKVSPKDSLTYIMGNPPFIGHQHRSASQIKDMDTVFTGCDSKYGKVDYVGAWFKKAADFIKSTKICCSFVSTNSLCQGESIPALWESLLYDVEIIFAYRSFVWESDAEDAAAVHCVIVGFKDKDYSFPRKKILIDEKGINTVASNINAYLVNGPNVVIDGRGFKLHPELPNIVKGSQPTDDGNLFFTKEEKEEFLTKHPDKGFLFRRFFGAHEFIRNSERYCLWLEDIAPSMYKNIPEIKERLRRIAEFRKGSPTKSVQDDALTPYLFTQIRQPTTDYLLIPSHSSENRIYIPIGFVSSDVICGNANYMIPNASLYMFGILNSSVHQAWVRCICGRIKSDMRYSPFIYNNFPWVVTDQSTKEKIESTAKAILDVRNAYSDRTLYDLYDGIGMPKKLIKAHKDNDRAVLSAYDLKPNATEQEIVSRLMHLYVERSGYVKKEEIVGEAVKKIVGRSSVPSWLNELKEQCMRGEISVEDLIEKGKLLKSELSPKKSKKSAK